MSSTNDECDGRSEYSSDTSQIGPQPVEIVNDNGTITVLKKQKTKRKFPMKKKKKIDPSIPDSDLE